MAASFVIAGGGTAGHVLPGLAIAAELVASGQDPASIRFIGSERGVEAELVPAGGFSVELLPGRGIQRKLTAQNLVSLIGLARALALAFRSLRRDRPSAVLCLGGYASVAASVAAVLLRIPVVVAEQNARAGAANRLIGRAAKFCAVPVAGVDLTHAVVTGNPVRAEIRAAAEVAVDPVRRAALRRRLGVADGRRFVVAFAGSLGARRINDAVTSMVAARPDRTDLAVLHVLGRRDAPTHVAPVLEEGGTQYEAVAYEDDMASVLAAADLAVCRAGGTTVAELGVVGLGAVLVPLPIAPRDHQRHNAAALVDAGAAVLVPDAELDGARLGAVLDELLAGDRPERMAAAARGVGRPDAAAAVADLLRRAAGG